MNDDLRQLIAEIRTLKERVSQLEAANLSLSAADILAQIKTVDGAGSGLDADTLDTLSSASFALLSGATFTGNIGVGVAASALSRPAAGVVRQALEGVTIADNGTISVATTAGRALVYLYYATVGVSALAIVEGSSSTTLIYGSTSYFGTAVDTASRINIYASSTNVVIQNKRGASAFVAVQMWNY